MTILARETPKTENQLNECEKSINDELLAKLLTNPNYDQKYQNIFSLPKKEGGMNIIEPEDRFKEYERSVQLSSLLSLSLPEAELKQQQIIQETKIEKELAIKSKKTKNRSALNKNEIRSLDLGCEKGASSCLNDIPLKRYHFD